MDRSPITRDVDRPERTERRWLGSLDYLSTAVMAWGFWLSAIDRPYGVMTAFAPALMTFLLLRVSGVTLLEAQLTKTRPGYAEYLRKTSSFWPRTPRR